MAGRSETDAEAVIRLIEDLATEVYAQAATEVLEGSKGRPPAERLKAADQVSKAGRSLKLFRSAGRRLANDLAAIRKLGSAPGAKSEETPMNDDTPWTPERLAVLRADLEGRLKAFRGTLEYKRGLAVDDAGGSGASPEGLAVPGRPPTSPA
jgi:hypothetical protein